MGGLHVQSGSRRLPAAHSQGRTALLLSPAPCVPRRWPTSPGALASLCRDRPSNLYQWPDFYGFLDVLRLTALCLRTPGDFARAVYEYVEDAVRDGNLRHVEFFFNPDYFYPNGIDYPSMVDGMIAGIEAARKQFGVSCSADRLHRPFDQFASAGTGNRRDRDRPSPRPRGRHRPRRRRARRAPRLVRRGLWRPGPSVPGCIAPRIAARTTSTLRRGAAATNYLICRDVLRCDRIDHGYNMLASEFVMAEARRDGLYFTPCAWTSLLHNRPHRPQRIRRMARPASTSPSTPTIRRCSRPISATAIRRCSNRSAGALEDGASL